MRLAVAVEGLEHAMVSRDIEVIGSAIARFGPDAPDTDALWRATMLKKELFASIKEAKRQAEKAVPPPAEKVTTAVAVQRLEEAMKANDLATLKAAITQYEEAADETDALEDARVMLKRMNEERKAEKKRRLKEGAKDGGAKPSKASAPDEPPAPAVDAAAQSMASMAVTSAPPPASQRAPLDVSDNAADAAPPAAPAAPALPAGAHAVAALEAAIRGADVNSSAVLAQHRSDGRRHTRVGTRR